MLAELGHSSRVSVQVSNALGRPTVVTASSSNPTTFIVAPSVSHDYLSQLAMCGGGQLVM